MAGYIGTQAVSVNTTSATISDDLSVGDDITLRSDAAVLGFGVNNDVTLTHVHNTGLLLNSSRQLQFGDSATHIAQSADGVLTITSDNAIVLDAGGDASIDIDGADLNIKDGGVSYLQITHSSPDLHLKNPISDGDMLLIGNDGGAAVTALKLDMSLAGEAVFNAGVVVNESGIDSNFRVEGVSNTTMLFVDAGTDRVAIGHGTPHAKLDVMGQGTAIDNLSMLIGADEGNAVNPGRTNGADKACRIGVPHRDTSEQAMALIVASSTGSTTKNNITIGGGTGVLNGATEIHFNISDDATTTNGTLRMSIAQAGLVSIGTVPAVGGQLNLKATGDRCVSTMQVNANGDGAICFFNALGTGVGNVLVNSSSVTYGTSSDYRLKENVDYDWDATTRLKQLKPARFNFISDADTTVDGFLAHEAQAVVPESVQGTHNETQTLANVVLSASNTVLAENIEQSDWTAGKSATTDEDGNAVTAIYPSDSTWAAEHVVPKMQGIDQAKIVPLLVKTIQELEARITALES